MMKFNIFHRIMPAAAMIICIYELHCSSSSSSAISPIRIDGIMNQWERWTLTTSTDQTQRSLRGRIKEDISLEGSSESRDVLIVNHEMTRSAALDNEYDEMMIEDVAEELDQTNPEIVQMMKEPQVQAEA